MTEQKKLTESYNKQCIYGTELDEFLEDDFDLVTMVGEFHD